MMKIEHTDLLRILVYVIVIACAVSGIIKLFSGEVNEFVMFMEAFGAVVIALIAAAGFGKSVSKAADGLKAKWAASPIQEPDDGKS